MEQCIILKGVYKEIFNEDFDYSKLDNRLKLQKIIYLLQEMGLNVGGYGFYWYKYSPYSLSLQEDASRSNIYIGQTIDFTDNAKNIIDKLKNMVNTHTKVKGYDGIQWIEALVSIRHLKSQHYNDNEVLEELVSRKPHLNIEYNNEYALEIINLIFP